ncbi:hypothetical protein DFH06DRAFT_1128685 [Mycena polygramma]|nr:hypothetical protein DFH06DRAFT_1128685 [Mycena polygramma]
MHQLAIEPDTGVNVVQYLRWILSCIEMKPLTTLKLNTLRPSDEVQLPLRFFFASLIDEARIPYRNTHTPRESFEHPGLDQNQGLSKPRKFNAQMIRLQAAPGTYILLYQYKSLEASGIFCFVNNSKECASNGQLRHLRKTDRNSILNQSRGYSRKDLGGWDIESRPIVRRICNVKGSIADDFMGVRPEFFRMPLKIRAEKACSTRAGVIASNPLVISTPWSGMLSKNSGGKPGSRSYHQERVCRVKKCLKIAQLGRMQTNAAVASGPTAAIDNDLGRRRAGFLPSRLSLSDEI